MITILLCFIKPWRNKGHGLAKNRVSLLASKIFNDDVITVASQSTKLSRNELKTALSLSR